MFTKNELITLKVILIDKIVMIKEKMQNLKTNNININDIEAIENIQLLQKTLNNIENMKQRVEQEIKELQNTITL
jgi:hypothetical protein